MDAMVGPIAARYRSRVQQGELTADPAQFQTIEALEDLLERLREHRLARKGSPLGWMFARKKTRVETPKGLYIWGDVGRGKTMLMDLFFDEVPVQRKSRVHFQEFMRDVHTRIKRYRDALVDGGNDRKGSDPVLNAAEEIAEETKLLCFDEFTVTDIADAMILSRLFTRLFENDVVVVATSNIHPNDLYPNGQNREHLLPFIALLQKRSDVLRLDSKTDYRLGRLTGERVYWSPLGATSDAEIQRIWVNLTERGHGRPDVIKLKGRSIEIAQVEKGVARVPFAHLCARPLGGSDYLAVADAYHTLIIEQIPVFGPSTRNEARRFVLLVDALYNAKVRLIVSAAAEPDDLYKDDTGTAAFEFSRTASRLHEMRSADYVEAATELAERHLAEAAVA